MLRHAIPKHGHIECPSTGPEIRQAFLSFKLETCNLKSFSSSKITNTILNVYFIKYSILYKQRCEFMEVISSSTINIIKFVTGFVVIHTQTKAPASQQVGTAIFYLKALKSKLMLYFYSGFLFFNMTQFTKFV